MSARRRKKAEIPGYLMTSDSAYLFDGECPKCNSPIEWVRESSGSSHNADCRKCMVIWNATPQSVVFEITGCEAKLTSAGATDFADR